MRTGDRRRLAIATAAAAFAAFVYGLGVAVPPRPAVIATDRLGPENGEPVAEYLARARASLAGADGTAGHWALLSFTTGITADRIPEYAGGLRISEITYHVPLDRVRTPIVTVPVPAGDEAARASVKAAAYQVEYLAPLDARAVRVNAVTAARLRANCACVVGIVVYGTLPELRALALLPSVRAVEALPADAPAGVFALVPLLPESDLLAVPGPDDGPVPTD
ncbi:hypothetical protein [Nocardia sp. NPDC057668]|uniref:hypothetical protein n=1 Tax=Nocardia sp. NPDC057668 TaxID=3346202 RepID=UPI003671C9EF